MLLQSERVLEMHSRQSRDLNFKIFFLHCSPWRYFMETMNWANCKRTESSLRENGCRQITIDVWFLRYGVQQTNFFIILVDLFPFYLPNDPENQNFGKLKKKKNSRRYYHFTHVCHKWQSSRMVPEILEFCFLNFWFLPFYPTSKSENQSFEKMKKLPGDIIILQICTIIDNRMMCGSWDMEQDSQIFFSFWVIFWPFTH